MLARPDPDHLLAGPLGQWLAGKADLRERTRRRAQTIQLAGVGLACLVAFVIVLAVPQGAVRALQFGFIIGAAGFALGEWSKRKVVAEIKGEMNAAIAGALGMTYVLAPNPGPEWDLCRNFELVPSYERSAFEDLWSGTAGEQPFKLYEAKLEVERNSGKSRTWVTVFAGSIIEIDFARRFNGMTLVERQGRRKRLFGLLGEKESITLAGVQLDRVDMVDPRFEDEFTVWSNDPVESRYLVHPGYVERLMAVEAAFAGEKVRCLFTGGQLIVALESGNLFESGSLEANEDRALLQRTIDQFGSLMDLAAQLNERART